MGYLRVAVSGTVDVLWEHQEKMYKDAPQSNRFLFAAFFYLHGI